MFRAVYTLLRRKVGYSTHGIRNSSALFKKIKNGDVHGVIAYLSKIKEKGPNALSLAVNTRDEAGFTPLMHTVSDCRGKAGKQHAKRVILHSLLSTPVDVNATDNWGRTACHFAAQNNDAESVNALIRKGAAKDILDSDYFSPADYTMDAEVEEALRLPHTSNPPDPNAIRVSLSPSKIRTNSPASNGKYTGEEWWFGRVAPTHTDFASTISSSAKSEAEEAFNTAESSIFEASEAAALIKANSATVKEYDKAFTKAIDAFDAAEENIRSASLSASISNSLHRSNLPGLEYEAEFDAAETTTEAVKADEACLHLGEEMGDNVLKELGKELESNKLATDTIIFAAENNAYLSTDSNSEAETYAEYAGRLEGCGKAATDTYPDITMRPSPSLLWQKGQITSLRHAEELMQALDEAAEASYPPHFLTKATTNYKKIRKDAKERKIEENAVIARSDGKSLPSISTHVNLAPMDALKYNPGRHRYTPPASPFIYESNDYNMPMHDLDHPWEEEYDYEGWYDGDQYSHRYDYKTLRRNRSRSTPKPPKHENYPALVAMEIDIKADKRASDVTEALQGVARSSCEHAFGDAVPDSVLISDHPVNTDELPGTSEACDIGADPFHCIQTIQDAELLQDGEDSKAAPAT